MDIETYNELLKMVEPLIVKQTTNYMRQPISPTERLSITLRYLATGNTLIVQLNRLAQKISSRV